MTLMTRQYFFIFAKSLSIAFLPWSSAHFFEALVKAFFLARYLWKANRFVCMELIREVTLSGVTITLGQCPSHVDAWRGITVSGSHTASKPSQHHNYFSFKHQHVSYSRLQSTLSLITAFSIAQPDYFKKTLSRLNTSPYD